MNGSRRENAMCGSGNAPAIEEHLAKDRHVIGGGEKSCVACNATNRARTRIMHDAA